VRYDAEGKIVAPREIPCEQQKLPGSDITPTTPTQTPVAPRDTGSGGG